MELKKCYVTTFLNVKMAWALGKSVYSHWQKKLRQLEGNYDRLKLAC